MKHDRLEREKRTIHVMVEMFCRGNHDQTNALCAECQGLFLYALQRIDKCPYQGAKSSCARCAIHCYNPVMRTRIRQVMRYAGPRMFWYHPLLTILHYLDEIFTPKVSQLEGENRR